MKAVLMIKIEIWIIKIFLNIFFLIIALILIKFNDKYLFIIIYYFKKK
jgi:hypothetical protein